MWAKVKVGASGVTLLAGREVASVSRSKNQNGLWVTTRDLSGERSDLASEDAFTLQVLS